MLAFHQTGSGYYTSRAGRSKADHFRSVGKGPCMLRVVLCRMAEDTDAVANFVYSSLAWGRVVLLPSHL